MGLFRAYFDTRHFDFEGYGSTEEEAVDVCYAGWLLHCKSYRPGMEIDPDYVKKDEIGVYEIKIGMAYRDREPIATRGYRLELPCKKTPVEVHTLTEDGSEKVETVELDVPETKEEDDFWCKCEQPTDWDFWDDEFDDEGKLVSKHHYTCSICKKVTQIG